MAEKPQSRGGTVSATDTSNQRMAVLAAAVLLLAAGAGVAVTANPQVRAGDSAPMVIESDRSLEATATTAPAQPPIVVAEDPPQADESGDKERVITRRPSVRGTSIPAPSSKPRTQKPAVPTDDKGESGDDVPPPDNREPDAPTPATPTPSADDDPEDREEAVPPIRDEDDDEDDEDSHRDGDSSHDADGSDLGDNVSDQTRTRDGDGDANSDSGSD